MTVLTRKDVDKTSLWKYIRSGWLPIPQTIIPPKRPYYLWDNLGVIPYNSAQDYNGKLIDQIKRAIQRTLKGWEHVDHIGVWISGGIDSSTLLYLTSKIVGPEKVRAYSLTFGEQDESEYAKRIAEWCDVKLILQEMTPTDSINLTEEAVLCQRSPIYSTTILYISKLCKHDGTEKIFSALGLDELQAGYPPHTNATEKDFFKVETDVLWRCQSNYVWLQLSQSQKYVDVRFPYLDSELIAFCRGLPRNHKCIGQETKVRIRNELTEKNLIPKENIEAGRIAGTKYGFTPNIQDWFRRGYNDWCNENIPPKAFNTTDRLKARFFLTIRRSLKGNPWRKFRIATTNTFYDLLDKGKFSA